MASAMISIITICICFKTRKGSKN